jgi:hypothetical protein
LPNSTSSGRRTRKVAKGDLAATVELGHPATDVVAELD